MRHPIKRGAWAWLLAALGGTAETSYAEVLPEAVVVRFGLSQHRIARSDIAAARRGRWPLIGGIGWRVGPGVLGLIGSLDGIVELELARPYIHHLVLIPLRFRRLVVSLEDPEAFLADLDAPSS
jgi:hypothetical protein